MVWATKRRRRVAEKYDMHVVATEVAADHVHLCAEIPPQLSVGAAVRFDPGIEGEHGIGHFIACRVRIEAAVEVVAFTDKQRAPAWVRPGPGCGYARAAGMKHSATDGVEG